MSAKLDQKTIERMKKDGYTNYSLWLAHLIHPDYPYPPSSDRIDLTDPTLLPSGPEEVTPKVSRSSRARRKPRR